MKTTGILEDIQQQSLVNDLAEELKSLIVVKENEAKETLIEVKHRIGETIINHPAYKKGAHGNGQIIKELAILVGKSTQDLHYCIQFYEKYPELSKALETIGAAVMPSWSDVIHDLADKENPMECKHEDQYIIKYSCCRDCGRKEKV